MSSPGSASYQQVAAPWTRRGCTPRTAALSRLVLALLLADASGSAAVSGHVTDYHGAGGVPALAPPSEHGAFEGAGVAAPSLLSSSAQLQAGRRSEAIFRSLFAGLSTSLGAGIVLLLRGSPSAGQMAFALALAAGVMITVSLVEMWLPAINKPGRLEAALAATCGILSFVALRHLIPEPQMLPHHKDEDVHDSEMGVASLLSPQQRHQGRQWRLAVLLMMALTAHNFPEGLAVAVSSFESPHLGFVVMAAIAVHNIPEGIAIAMPVLDATGSPWQAMLMATLSGLAEPLGAILAVIALPPGAAEGRGMDLLLACVGGIMTSVAFVELLPEAQAQKQPWCMVAGLLAGAGVMLLTHELA